MTLIAGFTCRDGLLICADMEEVGVGASKRKINKLFYRAVGDCVIIFTGSGSSAVIDNAIRRMDEAIKKGIGLSDSSEVQELVDKTLRTVYETYVWPNTRTDHDVKLLIGYSKHFEQQMWITHELVTSPEVRYVCAGIGEDLANYFADRLYHPAYSEQQMVRLATFIFREVKNNVTGVGQGTQMWMLPKVGHPKFYNWHETEILEKGLPPFQRALYEYGNEITGTSIFPLLPFTLDVPYVEVCKAGSSSGYLTGPGFVNPRKIKDLAFK
jgi:20S proteasome alpha/beta subunit